VRTVFLCDGANRCNLCFKLHKVGKGEGTLQNHAETMTSAFPFVFQTPVVIYDELRQRTEKRLSLSSFFTESDYNS